MSSRRLPAASESGDAIIPDPQADAELRNIVVKMFLILLAVMTCSTALAWLLAGPSWLITGALFGIPLGIGAGTLWAHARYGGEDLGEE